MTIVIACSLLLGKSCGLSSRSFHFAKLVVQATCIRQAGVTSKHERVGSNLNIDH